MSKRLPEGFPRTAAPWTLARQIGRFGFPYSLSCIIVLDELCGRMWGISEAKLQQVLARLDQGGNLASCNQSRYHPPVVP
jgi:hypothetical protein